MSNLSPLKRMQKALILQDVFVLHAEAHLEGDFDPKYTKESLGVQLLFSPKGNVDHFELSNDSNVEQKATVLRYSVETGVRFVAVDGESREEPLVRASITATFAADYVIKHPELVDDEGVTEFSQNVVYHVWPYWREFIHSTSSRLRLPTAILPMFQPKKSQPENGGSADQKT